MQTLQTTNQLQIPFPFEGEEILYMEDISHFDHLLIAPERLVGLEEKVTITAKKYCWRNTISAVKEALHYTNKRGIEEEEYEDEDGRIRFGRMPGPRNDFAEVISASLQHHIKPLLLKTEGFLLNGKGGVSNCALLAFDSFYHKDNSIDLIYTIALRDVVSPVKIVEAPDVGIELALNKMRKPLVVVPKGETLELNDTVVINIRLVPSGKNGYHTIHADHSMIIFYGPSTNERKVGYRLCHIDPELQRFVGQTSKLWDNLIQLATPVSAIMMLVRGTEIEFELTDDRNSFIYKLQKKFNTLFVADSINKQITKSFNIPVINGTTSTDKNHMCMDGVRSQLLGDSPQLRVRKLTCDLRTQTSSALFNLYMKNMNNLQKSTDGLNNIPSPSDNYLAKYRHKRTHGSGYCKTCYAFELYRNFASMLLWLNKVLNYNSIRDIVGEEFLVSIIEPIPESLKKKSKKGNDIQPAVPVVRDWSTTGSSSNINAYSINTTSITSTYETYDSFLTTGRTRDDAIVLFNDRTERVNSFFTLIFNEHFQELLETTLFRSMTEARKKSIVSSILNPVDLKSIPRLNILTDTVSMINQFENHKKVDKGKEMLKGRDIRTIQSLHDELSFIINALNMEPKEINQAMYSWLGDKFEVPDTNYIIKVPADNITVKGWGDKQRHCIGSYSERAAAGSVLLLGIWDQELKEWFGHLSMDVIVIPEFFTTEKLSLRQACIRQREVRIGQFYGVGNKALPPEEKQKIVNHLQKCLDEWFSSLAKELQTPLRHSAVVPKTLRGQGPIVNNQIQGNRINAPVYQHNPPAVRNRVAENMADALALAHEENQRRQERLDQLYRRNY